MGNSSVTILYHIIIRPTLNTFLKTLLILKKYTKVGSLNFAYQIWFCTRLVSSTIVQGDIIGNIKVPRHWPFVRGIHQWPVDSPHKRPVIRKTFPCQDAIIHSENRNMASVRNWSSKAKKWTCWWHIKIVLEWLCLFKLWIKFVKLNAFNGIMCSWWNKSQQHDDVIKWKHFPHYWPFVRGIHWSPVDSPYKGQWCGALMVSLILCMSKRLNIQLRHRWFEMPSCSLWHHCNEIRYASSECGCERICNTFFSDQMGSYHSKCYH